MGNNAVSNNLTGTYTYNGSYWQDVNTCANDFANNLVYSGDLGCINSNWDYGVTLNEDAVKDIVEKITKNKELAKITPDAGPEIPKWTGFLPI